MTFTLFEDNLLSTISPEDLAAYLSARGWLADASSSPYARVWHHGENPDESTELTVPTQCDIVDYKIRVGEILRSLQSFESRSKSLIAKDILLATCDVVRMREVLRLLANEIETWAPSYTESKICHLAVTEVAQRLRAEADQ